MLVVCENIHDGKRAHRCYKTEGIQESRTFFEMLVKDVYQYMNVVADGKRLCDVFRFNVKQFEFSCAHKEGIERLYYHIFITNDKKVAE